MQTAITNAANFPFRVVTAKNNGVLSVTWYPKSNVPDDTEREVQGDESDVAPEPFASIEMTEQFVRDRCGERELDDCSNIYIEVDVNKPEVVYVHNKMAVTLATKNAGAQHLLKTQRICLAQIYIPFVDSPFEDWVLRLSVASGEENILPEAYSIVPCTRVGFEEFQMTVWPSIRVVGAVKIDDDRTEVTTQLTLNGVDIQRPGVRIFATAPVGYLSKREALTDESGQAKLIARRTDLEASDEMMIEFGFKFNKNLAHVEV